LGFEKFSVIGQSMGASVAMKAAELDAARLRSVVLMDVAGRVDPGVGPVIASLLDRVGHVFESEVECFEAIQQSGLLHPWNEYWDRCYRYDMVQAEGGVHLSTDSVAVAEDRSYGLGQDVYGRWRFLSMPALLVRATRELAHGSGFTVPEDDARAFIARVVRSSLVEIDANHLNLSVHPDAVTAIEAFFAREEAP
jgi:pimeloyl-ACP methyl ester carboxylesterase